MKLIKQMFAKSGEDAGNATEFTYSIGGSPTNAVPNIATDAVFTTISGDVLCKNCA